MAPAAVRPTRAAIVGQLTRPPWEGNAVVFRTVVLVGRAVGASPLALRVVPAGGARGRPLRAEPGVRSLGGIARQGAARAIAARRRPAQLPRRAPRRARWSRPRDLGFQLRDGRLDRDLAVLSQASRTFDETWEQPWGERRFIRNHYSELSVSLGERGGSKRRFDVVFRVYDDGLGFRYRFPQQAGLERGDHRRRTDRVRMMLPRPPPGGFRPANQIHYEYLYRRAPLDQVPLAHTPITLRSHDGLHVSIHEAALVDYAEHAVAPHRRPAPARAALARGRGLEGPPPLPFDTPWRTLQISDSAGGLVELNLILNLNSIS